MRHVVRAPTARVLAAHVTAPARGASTRTFDRVRVRLRFVTTKEWETVSPTPIRPSPSASTTPPEVWLSSTRGAGGALGARHVALLRRVPFSVPSGRETEAWSPWPGAPVQGFAAVVDVHTSVTTTLWSRVSPAAMGFSPSPSVNEPSAPSAASCIRSCASGVVYRAETGRRPGANAGVNVGGAYVVSF